MSRSKIRDRKILFLCRENSCLGFIAEAIAKKLLPPKTQVFRAGPTQGKIDSKVLQVLREIGINVSPEKENVQDVAAARDIDLIVTLGEPTEALPPVSPRARRRTWDMTDPCNKPEADLDAFRNARDEINSRVGGLFLDYWRNVA